MMTDQQLCTQFINGNASAFDVLMRRWEPMVNNLVYRYLMNVEDMRDVTQEVFLKVLRNINSFNSKSSFKTWIYRIAINTAIDHFRKKKINLEKSNASDEVIEMIHKKGSGYVVPAKEIEKREDIKILQYALSKIPYKQRSVIILKEYNDLTFEEIAEVLRCPVSTVKSRLYKGLINVRDIISNANYTGGVV